jgi:hercynylcysteine S-oxide lyase
VAHLDAAGVARMTTATIQAQAAHLADESTLGGYVAEVRAAPRLEAARAALAHLLGPDLTAADVAFHHSATAAFTALLDAWPLPPGGRVGIVPSEYGSNLMALRARATRAGLHLIELPVDAAGRIDLDRLDAGGLPAGSGDGTRSLGLADLDLVTFPHVPSQRGIVQPAAAVGARCAAAKVPLLLDVAQSLGQVDTTGIGAAAYAGTSRKWLCGPRGVGFVAVRPDVVDRLRPPAPGLHTAVWGVDGQPEPAAGVDRVGIGEAPVAARVGLAAALADLLAVGPATERSRRENRRSLPPAERSQLTAVHAQIAALAAHSRRRLDGVAGWRVGEDVSSPAGIVTLRPPAGVDPFIVSDRIYREAGVLTSAIDVARSRDMQTPLLRSSAHVYTGTGEIERLAEALERFGRPAG